MKDVMVYKMNEKITVIGPAIIDVLAGPINENLFKAGTMPMDNIKLSFGGNAYNEANDYSREIHQVFVALCQKYGKKEGFAYLKEHPEYIRFGVKAIK